MINHTNVERLAALFTGFFVDLNFNEKLGEVTFLEIFLGFIYAYKKILKSMELVEILSQEQIEKIGEILDKAIEENVKLEPNSGLCKLLEQIRDMKEEKHGEESED